MNTYHLDQRNEPRILGPVDFTLFVISGMESEPAHELMTRSALDISEGGIRYFEKKDIPENALLEIRLQPRERRKSITQYGRVRWKYRAPDRGGFEVGVQFVEATGEDRNAWQQFVQGRLERIRTPARDGG